MGNRGLLVLIAIVFGFILMQSCTSNSSPERYEKTPVDKLVVGLAMEQNYSIMLADMDSRNNTYFHKYKILIEKPDTVLVRNSGWEKVSDVFFNANINNLGMDIATKTDGKLSKVASPAGYKNFVGNERYGRWEQRNGFSFWSFYGKYMFMSSMFNMTGGRGNRYYWDDYKNHTYFYMNRNYYGPSGKTFGTKAYTSSDSGRSTTWASKPSSFRNNVRSKVARSAQQTKSKRFRNSSRYKGSRFRSRGGGFGK